MKQLLGKATEIMQFTSEGRKTSLLTFCTFHCIWKAIGPSGTEGLPRTETNGIVAPAETAQFVFDTVDTQASLHTTVPRKTSKIRGHMVSRLDNCELTSIGGTGVMKVAPEAERALREHSGYTHHLVADDSEDGPLHRAAHTHTNSQAIRKEQDCRKGHLAPVHIRKLQCR